MPWTLNVEQASSVFRKRGSRMAALGGAWLGNGLVTSEGDERRMRPLFSQLTGD